MPHICHTSAVTPHDHDMTTAMPYNHNASTVIPHDHNVSAIALHNCIASAVTPHNCNVTITMPHCYRLSKRPNCFRGTCSGLVSWRARCIKDASPGTRHVVPTPPLSLIALVTVLRTGGVSPMMPASSTTLASAPVPVPFPQLSPRVPSYRPIIPNPCALGQQVTALLSRLIVLS